MPLVSIPKTYITEVVMTTLELSKKIKKDYVTVQNFCTKHDIKYNTYKGVVNGNHKSSTIVNILKKHKYIKSADDLLRKSDDKKVA